MSKDKSFMLKENIYWTGVFDRDIEIFDIVMRTKYGTTYGSYIVKGKDKTALIEIAKDKFFDDFITKVEEVIDPKNIDYIITNHTEPDHTGSLAKLLEINPKAEVVGSKFAIKFLADITNRDFKSRVVGDGDKLDLGGKTLEFISAPFLHWPDTIWTYCREDKVLFTCDAFGCHYCAEELFNDLVDQEKYMDAYRYYFDVIISPFKQHVLTAAEKIKDLEIDMLCPGHGAILRKDINKYIDLYKEWSTEEKRDKPAVTIAYVSAYGYTKKMAMKIKEGIESVGDVDVYTFDLEIDNAEVALERINGSDGFLIGSPTIVGDTVPPVWGLLANINPFVHRGKIAGTFGSYGWSGEATRNIEERLKQARIKTPVPALKCLFNPNEKEITEALEYGEKFGKEVFDLYEKNK